MLLTNTSELQPISILSWTTVVQTTVQRFAGWLRDRVESYSCKHNWPQYSTTLQSRNSIMYKCGQQLPAKSLNLLANLCTAYLELYRPELSHAIKLITTLKSLVV